MNRLTLPLPTGDAIAFEAVSPAFDWQQDDAAAAATESAAVMTRRGFGQAVGLIGEEGLIGVSAGPVEMPWW